MSLGRLPVVVSIVAVTILGPLPVLTPSLISQAHAQAPIEVGFLWHMHQPQYRPGENVLQTDASGAFSFNIADIHNQRLGPYTTWPKDAVQSGLALPNLGAQVSFSGSLIQNLNTLEAAGINGGQWNNWADSYKQAAQWDTALGNPRIDLVNFGFNHPLMPLLDTRDITMQIKLQKRVFQQTWGPNVPFSKGIFPPESAFSTRIIPALVAEGIEWSIIDSIHLERATKGYPYTSASNLFEPNKADQINPAIPNNQWVQLNNLWAPSKVAAPFAYRPNNVQYVDPATGAISKIVAVPAARYEGNEDGRGGFGALQYEQVMEQYRQFNTDPNRPMFVMLHHDGDNFGGGSEAYYNGNFQNMVNWAQGNNNYNVSTVQDYLDRFPVPANDLVHIEDGSWAGADNGDPEFKKWLGDPDANGWSPDLNSWAVLTAAKNRVFTADDIAPATNLDNILAATGTPTEKAWNFLMASESSDYWYWDGTEVWDSNVTRGSNLAVAQADLVINAFAGNETTPPSVFVPQRESYNPGGNEWGPGPEPSDFEIWTYAYDVSGLTNVVLKYRLDADGENPLASIENETYAGGSEVGNWITVPMNSSDVAPPSNILSPTYRALRYGGMITGLEDVLVDYYVEAIDGLGNVTKTDIQHVFVGSSATNPGTNAVTIGPDPAIAGDPVTITYDPAGGPLDGTAGVFLHYGFDGWATIMQDVAMNWNAAQSNWSLTVPTLSSASQLDIVFNDGAGVWDNNNGQDWQFNVTGSAPPAFVMDGTLDPGATLIATDAGQGLYAGLDGDVLYVATDDAGEGEDVFIYLALSPGAMTPANWAKAGQIAQWDAYLADENDNDFQDWFDVTSFADSATGINGGVLEGLIDLVQLFGFLPSEVYIAVGRYQSADGGTLVGQTPGSTLNNGNIDAIEYILFNIAQLQGDLDGDGFVGIGDLNIVLANWNLSVTPGSTGDFDGDGFVGINDLNAVLANWNSGTPPLTQASSTIPEPATAILLTLGAATLIRRHPSINHHA
jgi:Glycosyl hydrolase family 57/Carbohydrate binding domain (family 25)